MDFKDYKIDCAWNNNKGSTVVVLDHNRQGRAHRPEIHGAEYCGVLGLPCDESICAPFDFIKKYDKLQAKSREDFLEDL